MKKTLTLLTALTLFASPVLSVAVSIDEITTQTEELKVQTKTSESLANSELNNSETPLTSEVATSSSINETESNNIITEETGAVPEESSTSKDTEVNTQDSSQLSETDISNSPSTESESMPSSSHPKSTEETHRTDSEEKIKPEVINHSKDDFDKEDYSTLSKDFRLVKGNVFAWNKPYKYKGYKDIGKSGELLAVNSDYHITRQAKTRNGVYYEAKPNVWIHFSAFNELDTPSYATVDTETKLIKGNLFAWDKPYNYLGYQSIGKAKDHLKVDSYYKITRQAKTKNSIYYEVKPNIWVHHSAFEKLDKPEYSTVNLETRLIKDTVFAWNKPYKYFEYKAIGKAKDHLKLNTDYKITRQAKTVNGIYYEAKPNVWVHFSAFQKLDKPAISNVNLETRLIKDGVFAWNKPYKYFEYKAIGKAKDHLKLNTDYKITRQAKTVNGIYYEAKPNVWVHFSAFQKLDKPAISNVNLETRLIKDGVFAWNKPYKYFEYKAIGKAKDHLKLNTDYKITRQAKTVNGIYYEAKHNVWVHFSAFQKLDKPAISNVKLETRLIKDTVFAWNKPYKYFEYKVIGKAKDHLKLNTDYKITRQAKTVNGIYYEAKPNVWVHQSAFEKLDKPAISNVKLETRLIKDTVFAWNKPYKYFEYKAIGKAKDHLKLDNDYKITRQAKTVNGIYYEAKPNVWVHYSAFKKLDKPAISKVSLKAKLKKGTVFAWDKPYNYFGYKSLGKAKDNLKVGTTYTIKRQAKTSNGIYYEAKPNVWVHFSAFDTSSEKMKKVQALLNKKYNSKNYGIYVKSLSNGSTAEMNANSNFYAASTGKLPAIYYTQKMINQGKLNGNTYYEKKYAINNMPLSYQPGGAGILQNYAYGSMHKLDTILNWTIKYSDNQGANFLGYYGASQFSQTMKNDISKIVGRTWYSQFNVTAKENAKLIEAIDAQGGNAVKYLQNTVYDNQRIPKYLPVKVGHKIGDLDDYRHDIAIVYAKEPYILAVMTQNYITYEQISILSKEIYDILK